MSDSLSAVLLDPSKRPAVEQACVGLIEAEVAGKRGVSGLAIKAAFKVVKKLRPDIITRVISDLLPEFVESMEGVYQDCKTSGAAIDTFIQGNSARVIRDLLQVTDKRAKTSKNPTLVSAYKKLRPIAEAQVGAALPRLGTLLRNQGV
ncbi:MAG: hypothetical protein VYD19_03630 [Myxococcota bacterium]|nr:hypothetical protein [Myxococcota bacterium]